ncbi:MAG: hypothetical protein H0X24_22465 [Ktedonobacterales bacterium]|nr:hypothetical protein [Ktedonobacterales bacterium]
MPTIQEYGFIDQTQIAVEVQRRHNDSALWTLESYGEGDTITLKSLDITIPITEIYRKVIFPVEQVEGTFSIDPTS